MRALVVDAFATMRKIIKNVLNKINITDIIEAENRANALELLKKGHTDIIISDWIMPEMTGIEFLTARKDDDAIKHIPFIMVTAEAQKECIMEAIKSGVDNHIVKPFTSDKLQSAIVKAQERASK
jgi:two-component system, chemotaxis family, chemotaxis protein CheY